MNKKFQQKYRYSAILLKELVVTEFKLRYQGSALGYLWSLLRPLFMFVILYVVFAYFFRLGDSIPHFPVYLLLGIVMWTFFTEVTNQGIQAIVGRGDVIRKINFPKYVIVLSTAISATINLFINLAVVVVFMILTGVDISWTVIFAPLYFIELFVFALALAFLLSALFVRFRDINYIWEVLMQAGFYASAIIYPLSMVSDRWPEVAQIMLLNPVTQAIQGARSVLVTPETETLSTLSGSWFLEFIPLAIVVATALFAIWFFKRRAPYFAEEV